MEMPRREYAEEITIEAPPRRVWEVLTDLPSYPEWNPMIRRAEGELREGARLRVIFQPEGRRSRSFRPKLLVVKPERELRWLGWPRFPGIFDSEHYWTMEEMRNGRTRLRHGAAIYGLLAPLMGRTAERTVSGPFASMNRAHKQRAEGRDAGEP